jgi:cystathionine beta-lyase
MIAVTETLRALTALGDGVVINTPVYHPFFAAIRELGRTIVEAPLAEGAGRWELDLEALERAFAGGARAYLLCHPHNPTGRSFARAELEAIAELALRYDVLVVSDEIHAPPCGRDPRAVPPLGEEQNRRGLTIAGATKGWNLAGLKRAVVVAGSAAMEEELAAAREPRFHAGHFGVLATVASFESGGPWLDELVAYLDGTAVCSSSARRPAAGGALRPARGGLPRLAGLPRARLGDDPSEAFLERGRSRSAPGPSSDSRPRLARLNVGTSASLMAEAVERMAGAHAVNKRVPAPS